jgi:putative addiction module killer protein
MIEVRQTKPLADWLQALRDPTARAKIVARIDRLALGNAGDVEPIGKGLSEMRVHYGPGYRVYYATLGKTVIILLCGGNKRTQQRDIKTAKAMAEEVKD